MIGSPRKRLLIALAFLLPNLAGFLVFTAGPILASLWMSVTDLQLTRHNELSDTPVRFVGFENYARILWGDESHLFWDYFGNTLYLMLGIPIGIAGSLALALMLNAETTPRTVRGRAQGAASGVALTIVLCTGVWLLTTPGPAPEAPEMSSEIGLTDLSAWRVDLLRSRGAVLLAAIFGAIITAGLAIGSVFFRTVFYLPNLLAGVALFLLWKTLYKPQGGLVNAGLEPILGVVDDAARASPAWLWYAGGILVWLVAGAAVLRLVAGGVVKLRHRESGPAAFTGRLFLVLTLAGCAAGMGFVLVQTPERSLLPTGTTLLDRPSIDEVAEAVIAAQPDADAQPIRDASALLVAPARPALVVHELASASGGDERVWRAARREARARSELLFEGYTSGAGLRPPEWLIDAAWAKTALLIMGVWFTLGGSSMLLYLAGLANIPPELYEAAAIDGATGWSRFINVTWPQLAPTTFFIVVMSTIGGLQGGFEQAMVMTEGKADTIVLAYYVYNLAFRDQFQLGLASAVAWVMFAMIFALTVVNFRFGSRMTND